MVSVGAPGMANSTTSLWLSLSAYATVLGATLIIPVSWHLTFYNILFRDFHFDIRHAHSIYPKAYIATAFSPTAAVQGCSTLSI